MTDQDARDHLDGLIERAVELTLINGVVAAAASSMRACPEAWEARARFLAAADQLATAPGVTAAEVEQVAGGILALADVAPDCGG